jgi:hypothetical protein
MENDNILLDLIIGLNFPVPKICIKLLKGWDPISWNLIFKYTMMSMYVIFWHNKSFTTYDKICKFIGKFSLFFFLLAALQLIQGLTPARQALLLLEPLCQPFFCDVLFWDRVSQTICPGLALNHDSLDQCLLSS